MIDRIRNLLGIGRATLVDDSGELQLLQVTEGAVGNGIGDRVTDKVPRVMEYGFSSMPPIGSEILVMRRNGERTSSIVVGTSHRPSRPKNLTDSDTMLYDARGAHVLLTTTGVEIDASGLDVVIQNAANVRIVATTKVTIDAPTTEILHDLKVDGNLTVAGTVTGDSDPVELGALRDAYNAHKHGDVKSGTDTSGGTDHAA